MASVWNRCKGLEDFVRLRRLLPSDYQIILVGLSVEQIAALPDGIVGMRRTDSATDLARLYSQADVYANPTYADTYPTTNLEAMACGTPVVTYRTDGSTESITDAVGLAVDKGDVNALAAAVRALCTGTTPVIRAACRARAEAIADKSKAYRQYMKIYNSNSLTI